MVESICNRAFPNCLWGAFQALQEMNAKALTFVLPFSDVGVRGGGRVGRGPPPEPGHLVPLLPLLLPLLHVQEELRD